MPVKREYKHEVYSASEDESKPSVERHKKAKKTPSSPRKERKLWTEAEETQFNDAINNIVKKNIWSEIKTNFPELSSSRSADVCINHWIAMYKKWQKS
ncbi:uncharacterized protein L201_004196 [Kwoniella dendrophila CBS 6074]|uniref:Myb-like domain-containing protein n=1 Tax=Kwoniella dendrophila CBS 6074 TaxID=1295534 RepID=A0AAX4JV07_9TREE